MVRLKLLVISNHDPKDWSGLNSTMVRLKHFAVSITAGKIYVSQFHYGSIKTIKLVEKFEFQEGVSIPLWFD